MSVPSQHILHQQHQPVYDEPDTLVSSNHTHGHHGGSVDHHSHSHHPHPLLRDQLSRSSSSSSVASIASSSSSAVDAGSLLNLDNHQQQLLLLQQQQQQNGALGHAPPMTTNNQQPQSQNIIYPISSNSAAAAAAAAHHANTHSHHLRQQSFSSSPTSFTQSPPFPFVGSPHQQQQLIYSHSLHASPALQQLQIAPGSAPNSAGPSPSPSLDAALYAFNQASEAGDQQHASLSSAISASGIPPADFNHLYTSAASASASPSGQLEWGEIPPELVNNYSAILLAQQQQFYHPQFTQYRTPEDDAQSTTSSSTGSDLSGHSSHSNSSFGSDLGANVSFPAEGQQFFTHDPFAQEVHHQPIDSDIPHTRQQQQQLIEQLLQQSLQQPTAANNIYDPSLWFAEQSVMPGNSAANSNYSGGGGARPIVSNERSHSMYSDGSGHYHSELLPSDSHMSADSHPDSDYSQRQHHLPPHMNTTYRGDEDATTGVQEQQALLYGHSLPPGGAGAHVGSHHQQQRYANGAGVDLSRLSIEQQQQSTTAAGAGGSGGYYPAPGRQSRQHSQHGDHANSPYSRPHPRSSSHSTHSHSSTHSVRGVQPHHHQFQQDTSGAPTGGYPPPTGTHTQQSSPESRGSSSHAGGGGSRQTHNPTTAATTLPSQSPTSKLPRDMIPGTAVHPDIPRPAIVPKPVPIKGLNKKSRGRQVPSVLPEAPHQQTLYHSSTAATAGSPTSPSSSAAAVAGTGTIGSVGSHAYPHPGQQLSRSAAMSPPIPGVQIFSHPNMPGGLQQHNRLHEFQQAAAAQGGAMRGGWTDENPNAPGGSLSGSSGMATSADHRLADHAANAAIGRMTRPAQMEELLEIRPYICIHEGCGKAFGRQEHLDRHVRSLHTHEKPYECPHCKKEFSRYDNLCQHYKGVHPKDPSKPLPPDHRKIKRQKY